MLVTKSLSEFCALLIDELYGELSSRIFAALLSKGRSSLVQLVQYTALTPAQVRHGISVLFQHNLLFWHADYWSGTTVYEANVERAYNLARTGKILEMVESSMGIAAKDVIQNLLLLGQTRLGDLMDAYQEKISKTHKTVVPNGNANGGDVAVEGHDVLAEDASTQGTSGESAHSKGKEELIIKSTAHLNSVICNLVRADLVEVLHRRSFHSPEDIESDITNEVEKKQYPLGVKGGKAKQEFDEKVAEYLRKVRADSKVLKRKLDQDGGFGAKRRKLFNGMGINGNNGANGVHEEDELDLDPRLDPEQVVRVNYEKCIVNLRNRRLAQAAIDVYGETTGHVYGVVLKQLTRNLPRCHPNPKMDFGCMTEDDEPLPASFIKTHEILDNIKTSLDLSFGIGKAPHSEISRKAAEQLQEKAPAPPLDFPGAEAEADGSSDEDDSDASSDAGSDDFVPETETKLNGIPNGKVKFADSTNLKEEPRTDRPTQLRQHLLLLAESDHGFLRHCGQQEWTVDFNRIMRRLKEDELDATVEKVSGRKGLRLVRILRKNGKLDEKTLQNVGLLTKSEVQPKMLEMQLAGFVHIQEVPKDNKADPKKSIFLWFCDTDRSLAQLLDASYKTMVRTLQTLELRRHKEKDVLDLTKRTDVRGREKEVMRKEYFDRYSIFLEQERKLFGQIMRLDDLVGLLRDF